MVHSFLQSGHFTFLKEAENNSYKIFETTLLADMKFDKKYPDPGLIDDKFFSELRTKDYRLTLSLKKE